MSSAGRDPGIAGVLLAAGSSRRFGRPKQLVRWRGESLVRRAARCLLESTAKPLVAVLGHCAEQVEEELCGLDIDIVRNARHAEGQSTSVAAGVQAVAGRCRGALFVPCDQPYLTPETLARLVDESRGAARSIIRPIYADRPGAPVLFPAELFGELLTLRGDEGGRQLMHRFPERIREVPIADAREGLDIDTEAELDQLESA